MAVFSTDQTRPLYVVLDKAEPMAVDSPVGAMAVRNSVEDLWFEYMSPNGGDPMGTPGVVRTDLISKKCIDYIRVSPAKTRPLKRIEVTMNPDVNSGAPVVGQEYLIRMRFFGLGIGGNENQYLKEAGVYRVKPGDTAADVLNALKTSIDLNFSREVVPYITATVVGNALVIEEVLQPWVRGKRQAEQINFVVEPVVVLYNGGYYPWGVAEDTTSTNTNVLINGRVTADMEWFYLGERGDIHREYAYPNNFETLYLADPTKQYAWIDIQYYYAGDAEDVQKSKKWMTFAVPTDGNYLAADIVTDLEAAGVTVINNLT